MSSPSLFLAYASTSTQPFSSPQLVDVLSVSRTNNQLVDVTGMLLYRAGNFLQALEGPEKPVRETMNRIAMDRRHRSVMLLKEGWHDERLFAGWSMAFEDVTPDSATDHPGLSDYLSPNGAPIDSSDADHDVFEFFRAFRDHVGIRAADTL